MKRLFTQSNLGEKYASNDLVGSFEFNTLWYELYVLNILCSINFDWF
jgi:hypothetical protein